MLPDFHPDELNQTLAALVRIDSRNPSHGGPPGGEAAAMRCCAELLAGRGIESSLWDAMPGRPNLTARVEGRDASRTLLFETHLDTVATEGMTIDPFGAEIREGKLWGRGSTDAKAQVAAMIHALSAVKASGQLPPVTIELALVVDEESGFGGVNALVKRLRGESRIGGIVGAVVGEPTELEIVIAHKGSVRWWVEFQGRAAHSAKPQLGINAIRHAAAVVEGIEGAYADRLRSREHPLVGHGTINVSKIEGGVQVNLVPERARILLDRRMIPGERQEDVFRELDAVISEARVRFPQLRAKQCDPLIVDPCLETEAGHPLARAALAVSANLGASGRPVGVPYCTDGSKLSEAGIATIVAGAGSIDQAHTADEWMDLSELGRGAKFYAGLMMEAPQ